MSICQRSVISLGTLSPIKSTNKQVQLLQMSFRQPLHDLTRQKEKNVLCMYSLSASVA